MNHGRAILLTLIWSAVLCLAAMAFIAKAKAQSTDAFLVMVPASCFEREGAAAFFKSKSAKVVGWGMYEDTLKSAVFMNADGEFWFAATLSTGRTCIFTNGSDWTPEKLPSH